MAYGMLSAKLCELDDDICRLHGRIQQGAENLDSEIRAAELELEESQKYLNEKLVFSRSEAVQNIAKVYRTIEDALAREQTELKELTADERLLLAEYSLDFAMLAARKAVLQSLRAIKSSENEDRSK